MAKRSTGKMHKIYFEALKQLGQKVTERQKTSTYEKIWKKLRKDYQARGETPPNLYTTAKEYREQIYETQDYENTQRDENMNTDPSNDDLDEALAGEILQQFISDIMQIHRDTLEYISVYSSEGWTHDQGRLANIAKQPKNMDAINKSYYELVNKYHDLIESGAPKTVIAQAIKDNVELDYVISITLMPPSDIQLEFERTIEQMNAILSQIETRAQELAEQAEREYYGE